MADLEKTIRGLECCVQSIPECQCVDGCPYEGSCWGEEQEDGGDPMYLELMRDALELLKKYSDPIKYVFVVRCYECKHWVRLKNSEHSGICWNGNAPADETDGTWFCSLGERKEKDAAD